MSWKYSEKSWKSHEISLLLIANHAREVPIIPYLWAGCSDLTMDGFWFMFYFPNRNDRQEANHLLFFSLKRTFTFLFVYVMNMHDDRVCLPGIVENKVNCHGKSHGILLPDFCGNPGNVFRISIVIS